jgi:pseudouridylate synthase / pseudouridine kinase
MIYFLFSPCDKRDLNVATWKAATVRSVRPTAHPPTSVCREDISASAECLESASEKVTRGLRIFALNTIHETQRTMEGGLPMIVRGEVEAAVRAHRPVVALESTIIAHGMPYPQNLETARSLETIIREHGAIPATIAVIAGVVRVGLADEELRTLAEAGRKVRKLARRDISTCVARGEHGATTVSATMHIAAAAGISVLATGGIGGVHRGVASSWDISADVAALSDLPVLVVCAGVKTILDVPKTLEALETASVPVITLNPDDGEFPGFYNRKAGAKTPDAVGDESEAARIFFTHRSLMRGGILFAVPIPHEFESDSSAIAEAVELASAEATARGIIGSQTTPYLLARIAELTSNASLSSNIQLVRNNAAVASRVASHLSKLGMSSKARLSRADLSASASAADVVVAGGVALDITADPTKALIHRTSNPGRVRQSIGGVGRNIAQAIHAHGVDVLLLSAIGDDSLGTTILQNLGASGLRTDGLSIIYGAQSATYCSVQNEHGDLDVAVACMDIFDTKLPLLAAPENVAKTLGRAKLLCVDANLNASDLGLLVRLAQEGQTPTWFEPVSVVKAEKVLCKIGADRILDHLNYISPNEDELFAIARGCVGDGEWRVNNLLSDGGVAGRNLAAAANCVLESHLGDNLCIVCTRGNKGLSLYTKTKRNGRSRVEVCHVPAAPVPGGRVISMIAYLVKFGQGSEVAAAKSGVVAAAASCAVADTVPMHLAKL